VTIGKRARGPATALALGSIVLSVLAGSVHAEQGGMPGTPPNDMPKCTRTLPNGHIDFYLPGDAVGVETSGGTAIVRCGRDGQWHVVRTTGTTVSPQAGGGVLAP